MLQLTSSTVAENKTVWLYYSIYFENPVPSVLLNMVVTQTLKMCQNQTGSKSVAE